jgi:hypothetical protein
MSYRDELHQRLEREAFAAQEEVAKLIRELAGTSDEQQRNVLKLRIQDAHQDHQRILQALFVADITA